MSWLYDEQYITSTGNPWHTKYQLEKNDPVPHGGAFLEFDSLRQAPKEEMVVKVAAEVAFSLLKAKDVVAMYLASSARGESSLTKCTLTVITGAGESSEVTCSPSMLKAAILDLEQSNPQSNPEI